MGLWKTNPVIGSKASGLLLTKPLRSCQHDLPTTLHTLLGYLPLEANDYGHRITYLKDHAEQASELLPRVHRVFSLLKRWLLGTHQGAVKAEHLQDYLDEFVFRFNRRKSRSRGKLFYRLAQQAVATEPTTYRQIVDSAQTQRGV